MIEMLILIRYTIYINGRFNQNQSRQRSIFLFHLKYIDFLLYPQRVLAMLTSIADEIKNVDIMIITKIKKIK